MEQMIPRTGMFPRTRNGTQVCGPLVDTTRLYVVSCVRKIPKTIVEGN